ncbi:MAG TPA: hypothetical protein VJ775_02890 [Sphingomicrobium sp.]|nr:hypothetical protein [Sphingomicrobium sp.]
MPRPTLIEGAVLGILAMLLPAAPASAQSMYGTMGAKSQAEVRISVRVMPRFTLKAESAARQAARPDGRAITLASNAPGLRYALVTQPAAATRRSGRERLLVLVVPD